MNKYIKTDIEQAVTLMKVAIMNALHAIDSKSEKEVVLGVYTSENLLNKCLFDANWKKDISYKNIYNTPDGNYAMILPDRIILLE